MGNHHADRRWQVNLIIPDLPHFLPRVSRRDCLGNKIWKIGNSLPDIREEGGAQLPSGHAHMWYHGTHPRTLKFISACVHRGISYRLCVSLEFHEKNASHCQKHCDFPKNGRWKTFSGKLSYIRHTNVGEVHANNITEPLFSWPSRSCRKEAKSM